MLHHFIFMVAAFGLEPAGPAEAPRQEKTPDDLATRLIRKTVDESAPDDPMGQVIQDMIEIAQRLQGEFDPGEQTQARQRQVSSKLDEAIKAAASRRRTQTKPDPKQQQDKRTMPSVKNKPTKATTDQKSSAQGKSKENSEKAAADSTETKEAKKPDQAAMRRGWGNLPQRDREEMLQGAEEESLERFRQWIDQYFKALQENDR